MYIYIFIQSSFILLINIVSERNEKEKKIKVVF